MGGLTSFLEYYEKDFDPAPLTKAVRGYILHKCKLAGLTPQEAESVYRDCMKAADEEWEG